jgi:prepilin-type N-terminal cleavage/methylation domain-containing protein
MRPVPEAKRTSGFTLIEMSIVILIIGLLMAFVLAASFSATESARVRATQALITKLNAGLEDRLEALLATQVTPNGAHKFLGVISTANLGLSSAQQTVLAWGLRSPNNQGDQRAQVLARIDQIKAEFPDVFFLDPNYVSNDPLHPIKFGGVPYNPNGNSLSPSDAHYVLPMGNSVAPAYVPDSIDPSTGNPILTGPGGFIPGITNPVGTGINGASYAAAASLYKLVGYTPRGCDGVDNNQDGYVDDLNEGSQDADGSLNGGAQARITTFLANHRHKTARSEMLYAILIEGVGPLGNVFSREEFRDNEVGDTDNDGVPEFIDGWGEPLQFFRWPVWHRSGVQKGDAPYGAFESRQQNALDPNGQLVALPWWCNNSSPSTPSASCLIVQTLFGPLYDRNWVAGLSPQTYAWDRSGASPRRAYFTRFLIISSGPDRKVGVPMLTDTTIQSQTAQITTQCLVGSPTSGVPGENWAMLLDPSDLPAWWDPNGDPGSIDEDYSLDDITNQELQNKAGGIQ